nr:Tn3 family transposase [Pseudomonas syringae group genomosp. 3]
MSSPAESDIASQVCSAGNSQFNHAFAANWGDGGTSSSDCQHFRAGEGQSTGHASPKCGNETGRLFELNSEGICRPRFCTKSRLG